MTALLQSTLKQRSPSRTPDSWSRRKKRIYWRPRLTPTTDLCFMLPSEYSHVDCRYLVVIWPNPCLCVILLFVVTVHRAFEQAGMMLKDMQRLPEAVQYIEKASMMYVENGTPDTAAMALDRAGKLIEALDLAKAVDLYQQAAGVFENEDRLRQAVELVGKASRLLVRQQKFEEAAVSLQKEKNMYKEIENYPTCFKKTIAQVLVHLHRGDYVAAEKSVRESYSIPGFSGSEDCVAMEQLLQGYDEQDEEQVSRVCTSPLLRYMDNDYAKLAISLKIPGGGKKKSSAGGDAGAAAPEEDEDEYAGGLC
ncbi:N-ethylmaleimide-sensitive factor attachment protein, gamma a isoform X1 [Carassius auratus]|uniref:Gamma-soluble NSF attachment protein n=1 Tax=Carassius auratus TaxID=7957 RepID=A0A6P6J8H3_CARAU|nr:gamma-soluble NSF attachment protein-like isoform X1 [Carassius auratus]